MSFLSRKSIGEETQKPQMGTKNIYRGRSVGEEITHRKIFFFSLLSTSSEQRTESLVIFEF